MVTSKNFKSVRFIVQFSSRHKLDSFFLSKQPVYHNFVSFFLSFLQTPLTTFLNKSAWAEQKMKNDMTE